ncbi:MAG: hypothetical protein AVDCRST_MAG20-2494 [uncultured Acidimicrobiales bacterium]|uniref:Glycosyltransferase RgtA/B/C/D-like domain-containing protein n=1 Tax=uncultured Acidimicrobiales bacterium TaxID=310071 RepID=A0A6J4IR74_9ACTN|nr:MAG: hypothetical protein AVDCRST_MAG20-2494 [uncultured Acidimicrobiales bacterium]
MALVACALAVATTWPLVLLLDDHAHDHFDPLFQAWTLDWVQHALGSEAPLWDANTFLGHRRTLAYSDALLGAAVSLLPFRWLGLSPIGVQNVGLLLGYAASGAAGYVFGRVVSKQVLVAASCGVVFGFGTYNTFLGQHMNIAIHPGAALAAAAVWTVAERRAHGRGLAPGLAALTAVVALQGTISFYTCALSIVAAAAVAVVRARSLGARGVAAVACALVGGVALLVPIAMPYLRNSAELPGDFKWPLRDLAASGADFLAVDPALTLWGGTLGSPAGIFGQPTFPGLAVLALAVVGLLTWRTADRRLHVLALTLIAIGFVLAIGASDTGWRRYTPYRVLYEYVPGGDALRATGRFWLVGLLGVGVLVGLGVSRLAELVSTRGRPHRWAGAGVATLCLGAVLLEGHRSWAEAVPVEISAVDRALGELPGRGGVAYLPLPTSRREPFPLLGQAQVVYRSTAHHRPIVNGYAGFYPEDFFSAGAPILDLPDERALDHLRGVGVRYLVVPEEAGAWQALRDPARAAPLELVGDFDGDLLYEVVPEDPTP